MNRAVWCAVTVSDVDDEPEHTDEPDRAAKAPFFLALGDFSFFRPLAVLASPVLRSARQFSAGRMRQQRSTE